MKKIYVLLFALTLLSCGENKRVNEGPISDINKDFTDTKNIKQKKYKDLDILAYGISYIEDSKLWLFAGGGRSNELGICYDLETGTKVSPIAMLGKASYELMDIEGLQFAGDSLQFTVPRGAIKTFSRKEIMSNIAMNERTFSVVNSPDTIASIRMIKLPNNSIVANIQAPDIAHPRYKKFDINKGDIVIYNKKEANSYNTIDYECFNLPMDKSQASSAELAKIDKIKRAYSDGEICIKGNDKAVFSVQGQFMLYIFDMNNKCVVNKKVYTDMFYDEDKHTDFSPKISIESLKSNDDYIFCYTRGFFTAKDKENNEKKEVVFVFDWDLNPVKRFNLASQENEGNYVISVDSNSIYFIEPSKLGLTLYKSEFDLE